MQFINGIYTSKFNQRHGREGALLRGRSFSKPVGEESYALTLLRYIHMNPVMAKVVTSPGDYRGSSYNDYTDRPIHGLVNNPKFVQLLTAEKILPNNLEGWTVSLRSSLADLNTAPVLRDLAAPQDGEMSEVGGEDANLHRTAPLTSLSDSNDAGQR